MCQLSKDRRMRNPGEKPLIAPEPTPAPVETEVAKPKAKQPKEDPIHVSVPPPVEEEEVFGLNTKPAKPIEVDESKLKEIKREEQIAKAKQALERKKKLAEQAAAKAKKKAKKEAEKSAEKKLKDLSNDDCHQTFLHLHSCIELSLSLFLSQKISSIAASLVHVSS
ncbi:proton pump-interactor 1-like protein [Tanacetum coccineum]